MDDAHLTVHRTEMDSPIGTLRIASTEKGLCFVELPHGNGRGLQGWLRRCAPEADCVDAHRPNREAARQILDYLRNKREVFDLPLDLRGTPFQLEVWEALLGIGYGEKQSYADLAASIGRARAVRAVGSANGANPIPIVVPCHRVIASDGTLGGYGGGLELKARLLAMEGSHKTEGRLL